VRPASYAASLSGCSDHTDADIDHLMGALAAVWSEQPLKEAA